MVTLNEVLHVSRTPKTYDNNNNNNLLQFPTTGSYHLQTLSDNTSISVPPPFDRDINNKYDMNSYYNNNSNDDGIVTRSNSLRSPHYTRRKSNNHPTQRLSVWREQMEYLHKAELKQSGTSPFC